MRVDFNQISPSGGRSAARVNALFTDFATASAAVDSENFAEEGLDRASFELNAHGTRLALIEELTRVTITPQAGWGLYSPNGTDFRTGSFEPIAASTAIRIRTRVWCETTLTNHGIDGSITVPFTMRHAYQDDGGAVTKVPYSARQIRVDSDGTFAYGHHAVMMIESWLFGPLVDLDFVQVQYLTSAINDTRPSKSVMSVAAFYRTDVP